MRHARLLPPREVAALLALGAPWQPQREGVDQTSVLLPPGRQPNARGKPAAEPIGARGAKRCGLVRASSSSFLSTQPSS